MQNNLTKDEVSIEDIKKEDSISSRDTISTQNNNNISTKRLNRAKSIRLKCLDCCAYQPIEVRLCTSYICPLWRYRMGKEEKDELYLNNRISEN